TRLRWLACGKHGDMQWDAFLAPAGYPLPEIIKAEARLSWPQARSILEQLTEELIAACRDKTLPSSLTVDRVWIQASGRLQLLETLLDQMPNGETSSEDSDEDAALALLRQVVVLTLEGCLRPAAEPAAPLQAPVPKHAAP